VGITSNVILFLIGLFLLVFAADWLIQACVKLSFLLKLTPLFIGLVLVAFGTSAPEAGVGIAASMRDQNTIALGNVLGSNIANIGLALGLCAVFSPLSIANRAIFKREVLIMLLSVVLLFCLSLDLVISRLDGIILISLLIFFGVVSYRGSKSSYDDKEVRDFELKKRLRDTNFRGLSVFIIALSIAGIIIGADLMVRGGVGLARAFGISPWLIGITVFAIGTSLPELVTSITAAIKKAPSISVGNIVGSNVFNILFVLGVVALIRPIALQAAVLRFEFPAVFIFSSGLFLAMRTGYKITRAEGALLFLGYIVFIALLIARA